MVKILLVEDNPIDAFIAQKVLMLSGAEARLEIVDGAAQALTLITNQYRESHELPGLILVDQYMPVMDGLQFIEAFSLLDIPGKDKVTIMMLTNSADPHLTTQAITLGAAGIITKPISIPILAGLITRSHLHDPAFGKNSVN